jgi:late competence protein required for DNA uptake (superfamily II DNA/RNA helicase)
MNCVRCSNDSASVVAKAPDGSGAWEVYYCSRCNFSWRTTEDEDIINSEKFNPSFKLDKDDLSKLQVRIPFQYPEK